MDLYFVYILKCNDDSFYIDQTTDVEQSLREHRSRTNMRCYTATRLPVGLVYLKEFASKDEASKFETQLKGWSRAKKQALIDGDFEELKRLSKRKFPRKTAATSALQAY